MIIDNADIKNFLLFVHDLNSSVALISKFVDERALSNGRLHLTFLLVCCANYP
jgi:hypothetical protein